MRTHDIGIWTISHSLLTSMSWVGVASGMIATAVVASLPPRHFYGAAPPAEWKEWLAFISAAVGAFSASVNIMAITYRKAKDVLEGRKQKKRKPKEKKKPTNLAPPAP